MNSKHVSDSKNLKIEESNVQEEDNIVKYSTFEEMSIKSAISYPEIQENNISNNFDQSNSRKSIKKTTNEQQNSNKSKITTHQDDPTKLRQQNEHKEPEVMTNSEICLNSGRPSLNSRSESLNYKDHNFWEVGNFDVVIKRFNDGHTFLNLLQNFFNERSELENKISKIYKLWIDKWCKNFQNLESNNSDVSFYGGLKETMSTLLKYELEKSEFSSKKKHLIVENCMDHLKNYTSEGLEGTKYPTIPSKFIGCLNSDFIEIQKSWAGQLKNIEKSKISYHMKYIEEELNFVKIKEKGKSKLIVKAEIKKSKIVNKKLSKYNESLECSNAYSTTYKSRMIYLFDQAQRVEESRLLAIKDSIRSFVQINDHDNVSSISDLKEILLKQIATFEPNKDVDLWSVKYGTQMEFKLPIYIPPPESSEQCIGKRKMTKNLVKLNEFRNRNNLLDANKNNEIKNSETRKSGTVPKRPIKAPKNEIIRRKSHQIIQNEHKDLLLNHKYSGSTINFNNSSNFSMNGIEVDIEVDNEKEKSLPIVQ